jgi:hypothetical protein
MSRFKPWKSKRETLLDNRAVIDFYASAADVTAEYIVPLPPERKPRVKSDAISEADVNDAIREAVKRMTLVELYRNNRGSIRLESGGRLTYGVGPDGAADWLGYKSVTITPEMVGNQIAVFVAIEAKRPGAHARDDQQKFLSRVAIAGGIAGVAHSADELEALLKG